jgi:hypothetical protein
VYDSMLRLTGDYVPSGLLPRMSSRIPP